MRQRRGVQDAVLRQHQVDVREVAQCRHQQAAVRERGSLGPSGGAARVEQPGRVLRPPAGEPGRRRRREPVPPLTGHDHGRLERSDGADQRLDVAGVAGIGHGDGRPAVFEDVGDLIAVQASVDRHGHQAGVPDSEQRLEVLRPVAHHDRDPVPGRQADVIAQAGGCAGRPGGELPPAGADAIAIGQRRVAGPPAGVALDPCCRVHRTVPHSKMEARSCNRRPPQPSQRSAGRAAAQCRGARVPRSGPPKPVTPAPVSTPPAPALGELSSHRTDHSSTTPRRESDPMSMAAGLPR